ncbi:Mitochondrial chaperone bcs1-b, partial [Globisporangium splendens]
MARTKATARKGNLASLNRRNPRLALATSADLPLAVFLSWFASLVWTWLKNSNHAWVLNLPYVGSICATWLENNEIVRTISVSTKDPDEKNHMLQQAVSAYIIQQRIALEDPKMYYELVEDQQQAGSKSDYFGEASRLHPEMMPPVNLWHALTPGVEFMHDYWTPGEVHFRFRSSAPDGSDRIDAFIEKAFKQHQQLEAKKFKDETPRYHFEWLGASCSSGSVVPSALRGGKIRRRGRGRGSGRRMLSSRRQTTSAPQSCKRYLASDATTFSNLFFQEKSRLIQTLNDFSHREGKFGVNRFAHRLGIFLHGPSGSGKTSTTKAISHYTRRHIVNISLRKVKTNKELLEVLQDLKFAVAEEQAPMELMFKDVVFVLEDVDCIAFATESKKCNDGAYWHFKDGEDDPLTVSGFLDAVDGMIESPGRMIVMTATRHENVHPALIRPGRVQLNLSLGAVSRKCAQQMLEHYFHAKLNSQQQSKLTSIYAASDRVSLTPADMEAICLIRDNIDAALFDLTTMLSSSSSSASPIQA